MHQIGIVVEGPTNHAFWKRLLARLYPASCELVDVVVARGQGSLIRDADQHLRAHRDAGYRVTFFVVDLDSYECVRRLLDDFPDAVFRAVAVDEDACICVAVKGAESWYLADSAAVNTVFPDASYSPASDVDLLNPKSTLQQLGGRYDMWWLARAFGNAYDPGAAQAHSASLGRAWRRMAPELQRLEDDVMRGLT